MEYNTESSRHSYLIDQNKNHTLITNYYYEDNGYWLISNHDIPILIGAAAGALGLILIFILAAVVWHCCQFAIQREKSSYSLNSDNEKISVSSNKPSNPYTNSSDSPKYVNDGVDVDLSMRRSISAPLTREHNTFLTNIQIPLIKSQAINQNSPTSNSNLFACVNNSYMISNADQITEINVNHSIEVENKASNDNKDRNAYIYDSQSNSCVDLLKSRSLSWAQSNKKRSFNNDLDIAELTAKVNYSKKRKNRMRNDSAAAIALNRSRHNPQQTRTTFAHKDTDTLVDNEAIVVYDERTNL